MGSNLWVGDLSRAWPSITGADLVRLGATGVIVYTGCDDTTKNVGQARFDDYLAAGLWAALVIENAEHDLANGTAAGQRLGAHVLAAADQLGYDAARCVLFVPADFNAVTPADYAAILAGWDGYAGEVPVPGYYGDSDSMDQLWAHAARPPVVNWQSDSASYSPEHPSPHAHLWQQFGDPRSGGLQLDVNDVLRTPLHFMGETVTSPSNGWVAADFDTLAAELIKRIPAVQGYDPTHPGNASVATVLHVLTGIRDGAPGFDSLPSVQAALAADIAAIDPAKFTGSFTLTGQGSVS